jgi:hypothetical protein
VLRLIASYPGTNPDWMISLNPAQDPADTTTAKLGFGITDSTGKTRLFIDAATGQIGVGTNAPQVTLEVNGTMQANGFRGQYDLVLNDYRTVNPGTNVCLQSPANDRDAWIYRDSTDAANNWGIYHHQIDTAVANLPGNSIGFVGGTGSKLQAYVNLGDGSGYFAGRLGIGTTAPEASLHVTNGSRFSGDRHWFTDLEAKGRLRVGAADGIPGICSEDKQDIIVYCFPGKTVHLGQENTVRIIDGKLGVKGYDPTAVPKGWIGGITTWDVIVYANGFAHGSFQNSAFDLAERFAHHEEGLEPGDVLAVDPRAPERLVKTGSAQQDTLVGVVSERPGFILGVQWEDPDAGVPLALAGRVPVKVNLEGGPVRIGDYLTSSSQPGVAMRTIQSGRVLGVAMQAFDGTSTGEGKVVVLVNPHWFGGR